MADIVPGSDQSNDGPLRLLIGSTLGSETAVVGYKSTPERRGRGRPRTSENALSRWIDANVDVNGSGLTPRQQFASTIGITPAGLGYLCRGVYSPSLSVAGRIEAATNGAIPVLFWLSSKDQKGIGSE